MRSVEVNGTRLSAIGLGTWQFGSREWGYGDDYAREEAVRILERALELGITLIDTAEIYGFGESERIIGRVLGERRKDAFLATKVFPAMPLAAIVEQRGRRSAARLQTDTIDLYQIHWPNPVMPIGPQMDGMRRLQKAGVVDHVGVSNFGLKGWRDAEKALGGRVISNQVRFSLTHRSPEAELLPWAQREGRVIIAYSPLGQGLLSAKYDATNPPKGAARASNALFLPENLERAHDLINALRDVAKAHDATPAQVALAWVISHNNVVAIPGASKVSQLESNAAAADIVLGADEVGRLTEASDNFHPVQGAAALPKLLRNRLPF